MPDTENSCVAKDCRLPDDDEMVSCETCKRWWHYRCGKFNPSLYDTETPWYCNSEDCKEYVQLVRSVEGDRDHEKVDREGEAGLLSSVDALIEAAKSAQSTVVEREREIACLKEEMECLRLQLAAKPRGPPEVKGLRKLPIDRLEAIREIDDRRKEMLVGSSGAHSTPLSEKPTQTKVLENQQRSSHHEGSHDSSCQSVEMANLLTILNRSQVQDLPSFSGHDKKEWPYFESVFHSTTEEGRYSNRENVSRLRKALTGEAFHLVSDRLRYSSDAEGIMDSLRAIFGRPDVLVHSLSSNLLRLPSLCSGSDPKLRQWAVSVNGFVADIKSMNLNKELDNSYILTDLSCKLSSGLYHDWQKLRTRRPNSNLEDFANFLTEKLYDLPPELVKTSKSSSSERGNSSASSRRVLTHQPVAPSVSSCVKCGRGDHALVDCPEFRSLRVDERRGFAEDKKICFKCLNPAPHRWRNCSPKRLCGVGGCSKGHHILLHPSDSTAGLNTSAQTFVPTPQIHSPHLGAKVPVLFKVVPVRLYGNNNKSLDTFAFLDDGSSITMLERDVFDFLGLRGEPEQLTLQWTKGVSRNEESMRFSVCISAVNKRKRHILKDIYSVRDLELPCQSVDVAALQQKFPYLQGLPLTDLKNAKPKLLLGLDQAKLLVGRCQRSGKEDEPHAIKTLLGWTVFGKNNLEGKVACVKPPSRVSISYFHGIAKHDEELHDLVKKHFSTEEFGVRPPNGKFVSQADSRALEVMQRSLRYVDDHYEIGLLWESDDVKLPDSYPMAEKRLITLEKSLAKKPDLLQWKNQHMRELVEKGYARIASEDELNREWPRVWYAPTFIVLNKNKVPPRPRDVADVAAKVHGVSLNSCLLKGPDDLVPLHAGLFKFRERKVGVNADVREMFHQIRIIEEDQQCQRVLWRDGDVARKPSVYIMQVMMFGPCCSPASAQFIKNHHANLFRDRCPEAVDGLVNRTYVDDYFNSHNSVEEAVAVSLDAIRICKSMNFELVGFQSNSRELLHQIPETNIKPGLVSIDPNESECYFTKVLGMFWQPSSDHFMYKLNEDECLKKMYDGSGGITKREILRTIMRIFDPLGLVSCLVIRGRAILQEIWREGFGWDEPISGGLRSQWIAFIRGLKQIEDIRIPRVYTSFSPESSRISLVVFVDASEKAFAAAAYWRFERDGSVEVAMAMAKSRVAPVKKLSVPRLELQAAVLGTRLAETVKTSHSIRADEVIYLSDSKTVLAWINSSTFKFPTFVAVRVGEILETTSSHQWWFIGTADNVADDGTRWQEPTEIIRSKRWFDGPEFMRRPFNEWPISSGETVANKVSELDSSPKFSVNIHQRKISYGIYDELKPRFRARWSSGVRVMALLLRFKDILSKKATEREPFVTPSEIVRAENWIFRKIQAEAFPDEVRCLRSKEKLSPSSSILSLSPIMDQEGTLRLSSRVQKADVSYAARNPAILPKSHPLVTLLVEHHHQANNHLGSATTISDIRERAWIISIRVAVERVKSRCFMCKRLKVKPVMPLMGQLPEGRLAFNMRPFTHVGVDCFGPLHVKVGRGTAKRYGMIFTCLTFRAVQIELLNDLSMDQCIMAVRRFIINRVVTKFIYSDNGLNFVGTKNCLEKDTKEMQEALGEYYAKYEGIVWRFIPAYSPWMGGSWERLIRSIKSSIEFILRGVTPREDVLLNALMEAQGQINRRPLTHIPVDPEDPKPLTPNSILFGEGDQDTTAPGVFSENDQWSRLYSRRAQHLMKELMKRWYAEYLPELTRRSKWYKDTKPVEVGSVVLVLEPGEVRTAWRLGRVTGVYPGQDGVVRIADVRLANGVLMPRRSVGRLAVLDLESSVDPQTGPGMSSSH